ncbi:hypothetical protein F3Y22_tig00111408pilonHSYRG00096 [Hibiscus syriacus]|uniref:Uncharacterized protein n=1 Tax=Hibiscus syriacus TaxID=106335 RepID=A0A6A2XSD8_HIBSY|nr:hypothetical protein F3Y22_tig00111408pilonHSYRG00096 [Hibiscus syriacus]
MISSSREKGCSQAKQEGEINGNGSKVSKVPSSSRQWSGFRNPRIVRVPRSFGGKDRHSKPSKVVDWLLEATKDDIDKLPPLQFHPPLMAHNPFQSSSFAPFLDPNLMFMKDCGGEHEEEDHQCTGFEEKNMQVERENIADTKGKWIKEQENQEKLIFPLTNHGPAIPGLFNNGASNSMPSNTYNNYHWEPSSNLSLSSFQFGSHGFHHQPETYFNGNACPPLPSAHSISPQLFFGASSLFPSYTSYGTAATGDIINHSTLLNSNIPSCVSCSSMKIFLMKT